MTDDEASDLITAVLNLAVVMRDEGTSAIEMAAHQVFLKANGDCTAAVIAAAALIRVELMVDAWWQRMDPRSVVV